MSYVEISLTRGKVALIDAADLATVAPYKWHAAAARGRGPWYARTRGLYMHRLLMPGVPRVDHRDGNGLNNQRHNLRAATHAQNLANQAKTRGSSRYKGVSLDKATGRWIATVKCRGRYVWLGRHGNESDAARAYNAAALELFGEFARLNEVPS